MTMPAPMLDVQLKLALRDRDRQFSLDLAFATDAAVVALYGPSGAGKSLSLQAIAGLLRPHSGHVRLGSETLFDSARGIDLPPRQRRLGMLFQHYALFPHLTVRQNIAFGLGQWWRRLTAAEQQTVDDWIARFGLQSLAQSKPAKLSGGQQQRVALARALACTPQLLLLDEPFAALNPMLRKRLREELASTLLASQVPALMVSHDIDDVLALAHLVLLVDEGRISGTVDLRQSANRDEARTQLEAAFEGFS
jgi:molybdate transport system ATP-binding protein